jgi:hypothetical protein
MLQPTPTIRIGYMCCTTRPTSLCQRDIQAHGHNNKLPVDNRNGPCCKRGPALEGVHGFSTSYCCWSCTVQRLQPATTRVIYEARTNVHMKVPSCLTRLIARWSFFASSIMHKIPPGYQTNSVACKVYRAGVLLTDQQRIQEQLSYYQQHSTPSIVLATMATTEK